MTVIPRRARVLVEPLAVPGAARFFVASGVARIGIAMTGLALLLAVRSLTGSLAAGGAAAGAFALGEAVASPRWARLVDRRGQRAVLPGLVALHVGSVTAVLLIARVGPPAPWLLAAALAAGACLPQAGACSAARWVHVLGDGERLRTAFSLEATANDVSFLAAPLVASALVVGVAPWAGSALAAVLLSAGCLALITDDRTAPAAAPRTRRKSTAAAAVCAVRPRSALLAPGFVGAVGVSLGLGTFFGAVPVLVAGWTGHHGEPALTGPLLAIPSAVSLAAGLVYGGLRRPPRPRVVQIVAGAAIVIACFVSTIAPSLPSLCVTLALGGAAIAPLIAATALAVQSSVDRSALTQAFAWTGTASAAGLAAGSSVTAVAAQGGGLRLAALAAAALACTTIVGAVLGGCGRTADRIDGADVDG